MRTPEYKKAAANDVRDDLVLVTGIEPVRCCHRGILSPLRLPIPPHQRLGLNYDTIGKS